VGANWTLSYSVQEAQYMKTRMFVLIMVLLVLATVSVNRARGQETAPKVENGSINAATFRIDLPANWNKGLVMYCHGYDVGLPQADADAPQARALRDVFLKRGFAFAQSAYSTRGWAVKEAIEDTEALRRYFITKFGQPRETFVTGHSMGAVISIATLERYPEVYDGGLPLCGPLSPALDFFEDRVFDMLVVFEYYFPGSVGSPIDIPADLKLSFTGSDKIRDAISKNPDKAAMFARHYNVKLQELAGVLNFWQFIMRELKQRTGGNPCDNRNTIYTGFDDDAAVNRGVKRYAADPKAAEYIRQYYTPTGRISDPVLTVQTIYDQLVPARDVSYYDVLSTIAGTQSLFVEKFVVADGHCNITPDRIGAAFDELLIWRRENKRPNAGELK
jgi:pimeloyl-ACP methyl ester carboxylesterase